MRSHLLRLDLMRSKEYKFLMHNEHINYKMRQSTIWSLLLVKSLKNTSSWEDCKKRSFHCNLQFWSTSQRRSALHSNLKSESTPTMDKLIKVRIGHWPKGTKFISNKLKPIDQEALIALQRANILVIAWTIEQTLGVDPNVACPRLDIDKKMKSITQRLRRMNPDRRAHV